MSRQFCARDLAAPRLVDLGQGRDDVVRPAYLGERELDAGAGGLLRLEEDELVLVADDDGCATGVKRGASLRPPLLEPQREIFQDGAEVDLGTCSAMAMS